MSNVSPLLDVGLSFTDEVFLALSLSYCAYVCLGLVLVHCLMLVHCLNFINEVSHSLHLSFSKMF